MAKIKLHREWTRLSSDILPGLLGKIRLGKIHYKIPQPSGRERVSKSNFSARVPFEYTPAETPRRYSVAVVCHIYHADLSSRLLEILEASLPRADIYISTDTPEKVDVIKGVFSNWTRGDVCVRMAENRGRDIAPKLVTFADVYSKYDLVLFLHTKKSPHYDFGEAWRDYLYDCLVGSAATVTSILAIFDQFPQIGIVSPQHFPSLTQRAAMVWGNNFRKARRIAWRMDVDLNPDGFLDMPSGSMFWARPAALKPLLDLNLGFSDFSAEPCATDGTIAHCIERLFFFACERAGLAWIKVSHHSVLSTTAVPIESASHLARFVDRHRFNLLSENGKHA